MLRRGEITQEALEEALPKELYSEVAKMIEAPQDSEVVEGELRVEIPQDAGSITEQGNS